MLYLSYIPICLEILIWCEFFGGGDGGVAWQVGCFGDRDTKAPSLSVALGDKLRSVYYRRKVGVMESNRYVTLLPERRLAEERCCCAEKASPLLQMGWADVVEETLV